MTKLTVLPNSFLTLNYRLTLPSGDDYINTFIDRPATVLMGSGQFAPCFEKILIGLGVGEKKSALSPRGEGLQTDWIGTIDLSGRFKAKFGDNAVVLRADVFNLLNSQGIQGRNEIGDLDIGTNGVLPNPNYGLATGYQSVRSVRVGLDISF